MFLEFFKLELRRAVRQPLVYVFLGVFALLTFAAVVSDNVRIGGVVGIVHRNAPHVASIYAAILSLFGVLLAAAFFNNAALRDYRFKFNEILFSTPLNKASYFFGRFAAALILATVPLMGVFLGMMLGAALGPVFNWMPAERFGPSPIGTFFNSYFLFLLPNMLLAGALIFTLASYFRSTVVSFVGALGVIMAYFISQTLMSDIDNETIAALADPFGISAYSVDSRYFTPAQKNQQGASFAGLLLQNRLIWMAVSIGIITLSYLGFSFKTRARKGKQKKAKKTKKTPQVLSQPVVSQVFGAGTTWAQFVSFLNISFWDIIRSNVFRILFFFTFILFITNIWGGFEYFGLQSYPVTYKMLGAIAGNTELFLFIIAVFFSGELVFRDRESGISEVIDASPHSGAASLFGKSLALTGVMSLLYLLVMGAAVLYQLINGFTNVKLDVYFQDFLLYHFPAYLATVLVFMFIQVLVNNKYLGYFISLILVIGLSIIFSILRIETNMLDLAATPSLPYSDMSGFGPVVTAVNWFNAYWVLFGIFLIFIGGLFWIRGRDTQWKQRLKLAGNRFSGTYRWLTIGSGILWLLVAAWVYYNTQILNPYKNSKQVELDRVEYEKTYRKFKDAPQLTITDVKYQIDIFPEVRDAYTVTDLVVKNKTNVPIDSLHYILIDDWDIEIDLPNAEEIYWDEKLNYKIFRLNEPLMPGSSISYKINSNYISKGFENEVSNTSILENGTFFNNASFLPSFGYNDGYELSDRNKRKKYDLPERLLAPPLQRDCSDACKLNYLTERTADWVNVETVISTSSDQLAIAPGSLIKEWQENGRNYYRYKVDHPSVNFYSFISARYEKAQRDWNGVSLEVYYDEEHSVNVEGMLDAIEKSLKYYTENFGPYFHKQARIIEFPRYATFAQAFPGTMPYSEGFGFIINLEDEEEKNNVIDAVIAHEMAHQWWAHQEISAKMEGGTMLTESLAEYSSLMVMKQEADPVKMKEFLKYDFNRYLRGRSSESYKELPLYRVANQSYIHYGKGSVLLYALQDYIGEDSVNLALREFLEAFRYKEPPYPTSLDLLKSLESKVPDSLNYIMEDWFEKITLYDLRLKEASYQPLENGKYELKMHISAKQIEADSAGNESPLPIDHWVDIGAFKDREEKELIARERVKIDQEEQTIKMIVDEKPYKAAVDPVRILIERVVEDNVKVAEEIE